MRLDGDSSTLLLRQSPLKRQNRLPSPKRQRKTLHGVQKSGILVEELPSIGCISQEKTYSSSLDPPSPLWEKGVFFVLPERGGGGGVERPGEDLAS